MRPVRRIPGPHDPLDLGLQHHDVATPELPVLLCEKVGRGHIEVTGRPEVHTIARMPPGTGRTASTIWAMQLGPATD